MMSVEDAGAFRGQTADVQALAIARFVKSYVAESPENRLSRVDDSPIFEEPLVGFASGDDPLFEQYKELIGPVHFTPREILDRTFPGTATADVSVICWVLPVAANTRAENARCKREPSQRWSDTKYDGERFNQSLRDALESLLRGNGCPAVAPALSPPFTLMRPEPAGWASNWSERHALYAAGMGTFSLSDGFITERGIAMRCGSVVAGLALPPTPRQYRSYTENCPFKLDGSCGVCIRRCPAGAISADGHDKGLCFQYLNEDLAHTGERYGQNPLACGLCQTAVPCESRIPPVVTRNRLRAG